MVAALLARQVGPPVAQSIVEGLRRAGLLSPVQLDLTAAPEIQDALRGKVRSILDQTLGPARQLARLIVERYDGQAGTWLPGSFDRRPANELAAVRGVGPTGADAILLLR